MKVWFPVIRAGSGSDVYAERLVSALRAHGIDACLQWFDRRYEFLPHLLQRVVPPAGTDLIHAISSWSGFAFARPPIPLVVTAFHCVFRNGYPLWKTRAQALYHDHWIGRLEQRSFDAASAVVALTPSAAEDFRTRFAMPPLHIIPGWVDTDVFKPAESPSHDEGRTRILIVGNASKRKGMDLLPGLVEQLGEEFSITVVGGLRAGHDRACAGIIYKQGLTLAELVSEYQRTDIVVSLSRYEGFGYTALEAMACGKPVVCFDVVGLRDVVKNRITGYLAQPDRVDLIAAFCKELDQNKGVYEGMTSASISASRTCYSTRQSVARYAGLYNNVIDDQNGSIDPV